jgi:sporulation protein YunB
LKRRYRRGVSCVYLLPVLVLVLMLSFIVVERNLKPTILAIAEAKARLIATEAINDAIHEKVVTDVDYRDLIYVHKDNRGRVVLMQPNTIKINKLASDTTLEVQRTLEELPASGFKVPLGQVLGSQLLANYGPPIKVNILPIGTVTVEVEDEFTEAGINQTRHRLYLKIVANVKIVIPLVSSYVKVSTSVPVAETIIVGEVPSTYLKVDLGRK